MRRFFQILGQNQEANTATVLLDPHTAQSTTINDAPITVVCTTVLKQNGDIDNNALLNKIIATVFCPKDFTGDIKDFVNLWKIQDPKRKAENIDNDFLIRNCVPYIELTVTNALDISDADNVDEKLAKIKAVITQLEAILEVGIKSERLIWLAIYLMATIATTLALCLLVPPQIWSATGDETSSSDSEAPSHLSVKMVFVISLISVIVNLLLFGTAKACLRNCQSNELANELTSYLACKEITESASKDQRKQAVLMTIEANLLSLQEKYNALLLNAENTPKREEFDQRTPLQI